MHLRISSIFGHKMQVLKPNLQTANPFLRLIKTQFLLAISLTHQQILPLISLAVRLFQLYLPLRSSLSNTFSVALLFPPQDSQDTNVLTCLLKFSPPNEALSSKTVSNVLVYSQISPNVQSPYGHGPQKYNTVAQSEAHSENSQSTRSLFT